MRRAVALQEQSTNRVHTKMQRKVRRRKTWLKEVMNAIENRAEN